MNRIQDYASANLSIPIDLHSLLAQVSGYGLVFTKSYEFLFAVHDEE